MPGGGEEEVPKRERVLRALETLIDLAIDKNLNKHDFRRFRRGYLAPRRFLSQVNIAEDIEPVIMKSTDLVLISDKNYRLYLWLDLKFTPLRWLSKELRRKRLDPHNLDESRTSEAREIIERLCDRFGRRCIVKTKYGFHYGTIKQVRVGDTKTEVAGKSGKTLYMYLKQAHGEEHPDRLLIDVELDRGGAYPFVPCHVGVFDRREVDRRPQVRLRVLEALKDHGLDNVMMEVSNLLSQI